MHALGQIELYTGDVEVAWKHIQGQWEALENSMLMRLQVLRIEAFHLKARAALASAGKGDNGNRLHLAEKLAKRIAAEQVAWGNPFAALIRAAVAHRGGDPSKAIALLKQAVEMFDLADIDLYEAVARYRLGQLLGDERGQRHIDEADAWMRTRQILNPAAMTRMMAPGFD